MTLRELFDSEYESLAAYLARHSTPETGEDLASEAFARLAAREVVTAKLLWRTALNGLADWHRNQGTRPDLLTPLPVDEIDREGEAGSFVALDQAMFQADFDRAFRRLPQPLAVAFTLTDLRGLTAREAALHAGVSQPTLTRRAALARAILKGSLS